MVQFSDLRVHYRTGRSYVISGTGKNRKYGYRQGVKCDIGDMEISEWCKAARALIERSGEQELLDNLCAFLTLHDYCHSSKKELEEEALQLHMSRIFDNEAWVYFIEFNRLYRSEVLQKANLRKVKTDCCEEPGWVTQKRIDMAGMNGSIPCPVCGRWSPFGFISVEKMRRKTA